MSADRDGRVDLATAQRIVEAAIEKAARREDKAGQIVAQHVAVATRSGSRRIAILTFGVVLAFAAVLVAAVVVYRSTRAAQGLVAETGFGRDPVLLPSGALPTKIVTGREIFEQNRSALYVMGYLLGNSIGGCCTAFAIEPTLLATNAHCVTACRARGGTPVVIQNDGAGTRFKITKMSQHPAYNAASKSADSPDVGLVRVEGRMPRAVTLANDVELYAMGPGDDAFVLGFPGRVMDPIAPSATFLTGRIGRVTSFREETITPDQNVLIQHDCVTRGGNSGSPIFNQYGHVVGIHAAHIDEEEEISIGGQKAKLVSSSGMRVGMRIDLLRGVPPP
jgi:S1-C subfamily serine protease